MVPGFGDRLDRWGKRHRRFLPWALALSLLYTFGMDWFRDYRYGIEKTLPVLAVVFVLLVYAPGALKDAGPKQLWPFGVFGLMLAFFMVAMRTALTPEGGGQWGLWLAAPLLLFAATYTFCGMGLFTLLCRLELATAKTEAPRRLWLWCFLGLMALWMPTLATWGPVRISADSTAIIRQALGEVPWDDSHPILYTMLLALCLRPAAALGSVTLGAYLFALAQMAALAGVLSYSVVWLRRRGCPAVLCLAAMALFGLSPVFSINAITLWKDIPFNGLLLLLMLRLYEIGESRGAVLDDRRYTLRFLALCVGLCFFRGNGAAIVLVCGGALALAFRRQWRRWLALFLPMLLAVSFIRGPVYRLAGIGRLGTVEAMALPLQQVALVAAEAGAGAFTDAQREVIERFIPLGTMAESYTPSSVDPIKAAMNRAAFNANLGSFIRVWLQLAPGRWQQYLNAWAGATMGYWKYDFPPRESLTYDDYNGFGGIAYKDIVLRLTGLDLRGHIARHDGFLSLGILAYITLFSGAVLIARRRARLALCLVPPLAVWAGLMAGAPTYNEFRYMLVFALALPVICFVPLATPRAGAPAAGSTSENPQ